MTYNVRIAHIDGSYNTVCDVLSDGIDTKDGYLKVEKVDGTRIYFNNNCINWFRLDPNYEEDD